MKKKTIAWLKQEGQSFLTTFVSVLLVDGIVELSMVYEGDLSRSAIMALGIAVLRALVKAGIQTAVPKIKEAINARK